MAAVRELEEETGFKARKMSFLYKRRPAAKGLCAWPACPSLFEELYLRGRFARRNLHEMRSLAEKLSERNAGMAGAGEGS